MEWSELADRIADYRSRAGLRQQDLAAEAGLDRTAIAKIENGQRRVTALELDSIARALDVRVDWFFQPPADALVAYRSALDPEAPTASIDRLIEGLSRDVGFVSDLAGQPFSSLAGDASVLGSRADADALAMATRARLGVDAHEPLSDLGERALRIGALIFCIDLGPDAPEGASLVSDDLGIAVVNGALRVGRRRLVAAHELGHLLTRDVYRVDWRIDALDQQEWEARLDQFARAMLLPEESVRGLWLAPCDGGHREAAIRIASTYQVDMATLARRLTDLHLATGAEAGTIRGIRTTKADIVNYDLLVRDDLSAPFAPREYQRAVLSLYQGERLSSGRTADLLWGTMSEADLPTRPDLPENAAWSLL